jgi:spermidine/putrescine transport system substrate-binding protein
MLAHYYDRFLIIIGYTSLMLFVFYMPVGFYTRGTSLNIYTYMDTFNSEIAHEFEQLTGTTVNVKYYDNDGEFLAEMRACGGKGYDILNATDHTVEILKKENVIQKLDYEKIPNAASVDKRLLGKYFDKDNEYSIPYTWMTLGIGYNKKIFPELTEGSHGWSVVFNPPSLRPEGYKVSMVDGILELLSIVSIYTKGNLAHINDNMPLIIDTLIRQKQWVETYAQGNQKYFLKTGIAPLMIVDSSIMRSLIEEEGEDEFGYFIPREGSLVCIENATLSRYSKNKDLANQFINFMISKKGALYTWEKGFNPSNVEVYDQIDERFIQDPNFFPNDEQFARFHVMHNEISLKLIEQGWLRLKLA